jgi:hypothetical protein
LCK